MRSITIQPGIGDQIWLYMKLHAAKEQFHMVMSDGQPQRGHHLQPLLPHIIGSYEYVNGLGYKMIEFENIVRRKRTWKEINEQQFFLSANQHLEAGNRLETFLPDLPINFKLDYQTTEEDKTTAVKLLPEGPHYIGIYTSAYSTTRNWNFWDDKGWLSLIKMLYELNKNFSFVIIGADWDTDLTARLMISLKEQEIPFVNTVGHGLGTVLECMRRFTYAFYFPSGLPVLSETGGGSNSVMFYPQHKLPKMPGTWCDPERKKSGAFKECFFCEPEEIFTWVRDVYKLNDRL